MPKRLSHVNAAAIAAAYLGCFVDDQDITSAPGLIEIVAGDSLETVTDSRMTGDARWRISLV